MDLVSFMSPNQIDKNKVSVVIRTLNEQRYLPNLISKANKSKAKSITIEHTGVFTKDLENLAKYLKVRRISVKFRELTPTAATARATEEIGVLQSVPVSKMVPFIPSVISNPSFFNE